MCRNLTRSALVALTCLVLQSAPQQLAAAPTDPFDLLRPTVELTPADRRDLDAGLPVARVLPGKDREVVLMAAVRIQSDGDRLVSWMRQIAELKKSPYVFAISRFSDPPRLEDLQGLTLEAKDVEDIERCRPGDCGMKLTRSEIDQLRELPTRGRDARIALQDGFRRLMLRRVQAYYAGGHRALEAPADSDRPTSPDTAFSALIGNSGFVSRHAPDFANYLLRYPSVSLPSIESFIYWSKERLDGKPLVAATHVSILRGGSNDHLPDTLVASKQIFATHYVNASLALTTLIRGAHGSANYLVYLNRSDIDLLNGSFAGVARWFIERKLKGEAADVLRLLQERIDSRDPP